MKEKERTYAKKYYEMHKSDPEYLERKRISSLKSLHKKKELQKQQEAEL